MSNSARIGADGMPNVALAEDETICFAPIAAIDAPARVMRVGCEAAGRKAPSRKLFLSLELIP